MMPGVPFEVLVAHHREMDPLLGEIQAACEALAGDGTGSEASQALHGALTRVSALWHPHVRLEEDQFTCEALDAALDEGQEAQFGQELAAYMSEHVDMEAIQRCQVILFGEG
jgi:hypothetical protein